MFLFRSLRVADFPKQLETGKLFHEHSLTMECHFSVEIKAPEGLDKIRPHLEKCRLNLITYQSGYNGKTILRSIHDDDEVEWSMDSSDDEILFGSGCVYGNLERAELLLGDLGIALTAAGYPHEIAIDNEQGELARRSSFLWGGHL
jgi:hypothetical protein